MGADIYGQVRVTIDSVSSAIQNPGSWIESRLTQWVDSHYAAMESRLDAKLAGVENDWGNRLESAWTLLRTNLPASNIALSGDTQVIRDYAAGTVGNGDGPVRMIVRGSSLSTDPRDINYRIDRVSVLFGDKNTIADWSNPVSQIDIDMALDVSNGWVNDMRVTGIGIQADGLSTRLNTEITLAEQDIDAKLQAATENLQNKLQQAWAMLRSEAVPASVTVSADATMLTRISAPNALSGNDGGGHVIVTGASLSTNTQDATYRIDKVEMLIRSNTDTPETQITVGLTLDVAGGVVKQFGLNAIEIGSDTLSARIDSDLMLLESDLQQAMAPYQNIATALGLQTLSATSSIRNSTGTELTLTYAAGTVPDWAGAAKVIYRGEKLGMGDPGFRVDSIDLMLSASNNWITPDTRISMAFEYLTLWGGSRIPLMRSATVHSGEIHESWYADLSAPRALVADLNGIQQASNDQWLDAWRGLLASTQPNAIQESPDGRTLTWQYAPGTLGEWKGGAKLIVTGYSLSKEAADSNLNVDRIELLLSDPATPTNWGAPVAHLTLDAQMDVFGGKVVNWSPDDIQIEIGSLPADTQAELDAFQAELETRFDEAGAQLAGELKTAWDIFRSSATPSAIAVTADGTQLTRTYAPGTLGEWESGARITVRGESLSLDAADRDYRIDGVMVTLTPVDSPTDWAHPEAQFDLDVELRVSGSKIADFRMNGLLEHTPANTTDLWQLTVTAKHWLNQAPIKDVDVHVSQGGLNPSKQAWTQGDGSFKMPNQTTGSHQITANKSATADRSEVGLLDAIAILKSIVGLTTLDAHQQIAADFDKSKDVGLLDAIGILKHVVGLPSSTPEWVFVDKAADKPDPTAPITVNVIADTTVQLTGILRGDVDGSWAV